MTNDVGILDVGTGGLTAHADSLVTLSFVTLGKEKDKSVPHAPPNSQVLPPSEAHATSK